MSVILTDPRDAVKAPPCAPECYVRPQRGYDDEPAETLRDQLYRIATAARRARTAKGVQ